MNLLYYVFSRQDWTAHRKKRLQVQIERQPSYISEKLCRWHSLKQGMESARRMIQKDLGRGHRRFVFLTDDTFDSKAPGEEIPALAEWLRGVCLEADCHVGAEIAGRTGS